MSLFLTPLHRFADSKCRSCATVHQSYQLNYVCVSLLIKYSSNKYDRRDRKWIKSITVRAPHQLCDQCYNIYRKQSATTEADPHLQLILMNDIHWSTFMLEYSDLMHKIGITQHGSQDTNGHTIPFGSPMPTFTNGATKHYDLYLIYKELHLENDDDEDSKMTETTSNNAPKTKTAPKTRSGTRYTKEEITSIITILIANPMDDTLSLPKFVKESKLVESLAAAGFKKRSENGLVDVIKKIRNKKHNVIVKHEELSNLVDRLNEAVRLKINNKYGVSDDGDTELSSLQDRRIKNEKDKENTSPFDPLTDFHRISSAKRKTQAQWKNEQMQIKRDAVNALMKSAESIKMVAYTDDHYIAMIESYIYETYPDSKKQRRLMFDALEDKPRPFIRLAKASMSGILRKERFRERLEELFDIYIDYN